MTGIFDGTRRFTNQVQIGDANTHLEKDVSNNLVLTDALAGSVTLSELVAEAPPVLNDGPILMRVDYATGTSPPAGTVVHDQAEYDALGYDLKYPQDALDILPPITHRMVQVNLAAGLQHGKPGNAGYDPYTTFLNLVGGAGSPWEPMGFDLAYLDPDFNFFYCYYNFILFQGEDDTEIEAAQAGTSATKTITRTSGTWTVDEHQGKFVLVTSGPGAGLKLPIVKNSTTVLTVSGEITPTGSINFEIVVPATQWTYDDGTGSDFYSIPFACQNKGVAFVNIDFGEPSKRFSIDINAGYFWFESCRIWGTSLGSGLHTFAGPAIGAVDLWIKGLIVDAGQNYFQLGLVKLAQESLFIGSSTGTIPVIDVVDKARVWLRGCDVLTKNAALTSALIRSATPDGVYTDYINSYIHGHSLCTGIQARSYGTESAIGGSKLIINDCAVAVDIQADCRIAGYSGSGNTTGWKLTQGAKVRVTNPQNVAAVTNDMLVDGATESYATLGGVGDSIEGVNGSSILRL